MTSFASRHIGPRPNDLLATLGYESSAALIAAAVPETIQLRRPLNLPAPLSEPEVTAKLRAIAQENVQVTSMIGQGYFGTHTPAVIKRSILENPAWYTAYTPYQPEISQGRLEAMLNFQTMIADLTGLPVAGASLLDEATAVAEAILLMRRAVRGRPDGRILLDSELLPAVRNVAIMRAKTVGIVTETVDVTAALASDGFASHNGDVLGVVLAQVGASGVVRDLTPLVSAVHDRGGLVTVAVDPLAATMLRTAGEMAADIAVGSAQRFGVPLFYGGPHAAFMSVRTGLERNLPGRLVGLSRDVHGNAAYRLALATREQHIRRERATSNICTAQALLAVVAGAFACYHGAEGLRAIAQRVHACAFELAAQLRTQGLEVVHEVFFDTVRVRVPQRAEAIRVAALGRGINVFVADDDHVQLACDETTTPSHLRAVLAAFRQVTAGDCSCGASGVVGGTGADVACGAAGDRAFPTALHPAFQTGPLVRQTPYLTHPIFTSLRSETGLMRYLRGLADKDLALDRSMIPLGSCTMKLNAAVELEPITWPEFTQLHPLAPGDQASGYAHLIADLETWLAEITGYDRISLQPNAGSQGELAGLLAIRRYHESRGEGQRNVCLIPASAHGTNAASAVLAGWRVVVVATAPDGTIDETDLAAKIAAHTAAIAAIMLTYPSTHGVYEEGVRRVCSAVHDAGGQVYIDGANLNALVGVARPGDFGGDVSHLNLHKTFCIPHGGGGPGVGPIGVAAHLAPFLPGDPQVAESGAVSGAKYGSAGILPITWAYIALMGGEGLKQATEMAVAAANYVARQLADYYPVLYTGAKGLVAHECILDIRDIAKTTGITAEDIAKRLADYGFHAPTLSFPVAGTLMVEPTESEDTGELDRFIAAMIAIRAEIDAVGDAYDAASSPLRGAPHTGRAVTTADWDRPYSREQAAFPPGVCAQRKYWPPVGRIDQAYGDRHLVCSCPPLTAFDED